MRMFKLFGPSFNPSVFCSLISVLEQSDFTPEEFDQLADLKVGEKLVLDPEGPTLVVERVS